MKCIELGRKRPQQRGFSGGHRRPFVVLRGTWRLTARGGRSRPGLRGDGDRHRQQALPTASSHQHRPSRPRLPCRQLCGEAGGPTQQGLLRAKRLPQCSHPGAGALPVPSWRMKGNRIPDISWRPDGGTWLLLPCWRGSRVHRAETGGLLQCPAALSGHPAFASRSAEQGLPPQALQAGEGLNHQQTPHVLLPSPPSRQHPSSAPSHGT